ncbi:hypothetical protein QO009_003029 [Brevibacillus aydinogluensis]|jgi:hypothetical protein|nr:hypothetical protein [Brevibacillus aydinogluensis]
MSWHVKRNSTVKDSWDMAEIINQRFALLFDALPQGSSQHTIFQKLYKEGQGYFGTDGTSERIIRTLARHAIPFIRKRANRFFDQIEIVS